MTSDSQVTAQTHHPRQPRFRQGDSSMGKLNALYDRWRGPVTLFVPLIGGILAALGFQYISPSQRLDAQTKTIQTVIHRIERQEERIAATDSSLRVMSQKLDLLVDLACNGLTPDQRLVARRTMACDGGGR